MNLTHTNKLPLAPDRPDDAHKGSFGTVIVVGGCDTMMGAPALCASAALRSGVGLVKIATTAAVLPTAIAIEPGATGILLTDDTSANLEAISRSDPDAKAVLAVGPGLGRAQQTGELVTALMAGPRRMVLDADGLNLLAQLPDPPARNTAGGLVMTPHPGEFARLAKRHDISHSPTEEEDRPAAAAALALAYQKEQGDAVVVLKGHRTIVTDGRQCYTNTTGNPVLASAGSGDVLTGCIASLLAQGMALFDAAVLGVYLHGLAADLWAREFGNRGLAAKELAAMLPDAFEDRRQYDLDINEA